MHKQPLKYQYYLLCSALLCSALKIVISPLYLSIACLQYTNLYFLNICLKLLFSDNAYQIILIRHIFIQIISLSFILYLNLHFRIQSPQFTHFLVLICGYRNPISSGHISIAFFGQIIAHIPHPQHFSALAMILFSIYDSSQHHLNNLGILFFISL